MNRNPTVLGISALYHDSASCILQDGIVSAAVQEERLSRRKHDPRFPTESVRACLEVTGLSIDDIDVVAYYEQPERKRHRQTQTLGTKVSISSPELPGNLIRYCLGYDGDVLYFPHHLSHAASSYFFSGFKESAVLVVDGVGEWSTISYGVAKEKNIELFESVSFPHSIGLLYSVVTGFLGFEVNGGEYKVMGLAPYGSKEAVELSWRLLENSPGGGIRVNTNILDFTASKEEIDRQLTEYFGIPPRKSSEPLTNDHANIARSIQHLTEEVLVSKAQYLHSSVGSKNLCLAGGVALNCVANMHIRQRGGFENLFVQPAAGDAGGALGAAALAYNRVSEDPRGYGQIKNVFWGPEVTNREAKRVLDIAAINYASYETKQTNLIEFIVEKLASGNVIALHTGRMEFGPRALGARSILADPRGSGTRDHINQIVKKRESFRPFAPAVLVEYAQEYFDISGESPFMIETCAVAEKGALPAITHVDGTARVQTVSMQSNSFLARLLRKFYARTGCPVLLNTSFNLAGEPIVCSVQDSLRSFIKSELDILVINDFVVDRKNVSMHSRNFVLAQSSRHRAYHWDVYSLL